MQVETSSSSSQFSTFDLEENSSVTKQNLGSPNIIELVSLTLENITYTAPYNDTSKASKTRQKPILSNISTRIQPHTLNAWMGPSGSGKTSLISVTAQITPVTSGTIKVNGELGRVPKRYVSIVWQDDLLLSNLSVEETIMFAAQLKCKNCDSVQNVVNYILEELNLNHVRHSLIGDMTKRGISGGERKRVAVAVELVSNPSVLLLDEPTSGLDATTAFSLIQMLRRLACENGHSIAVAIHQPRTSIFNLFDNVLLLSKGQTVYNGAQEYAREYLETLIDPNTSQPICGILPPQTGIADWFMDVIVQDEMRANALLPVQWENSQPNLKIESPAKNSNRKLSSLKELKNQKKYTTSLSKQFYLLLKRSMKQQRGERITQASFIVTFLYIIFTISFWWRLPFDTSRIYERKSLLFFAMIVQSVGVVTANIATISRERLLLERERNKKMYSVLPFFLSKTTSEMTNTVAFPMIYSIFIYWCTNLRPSAEAFLVYMCIYYLCLVTMQSLGVLLSVLIRNLQILLLVVPVLNIMLMILGGFYASFDKIPWVIRWVSYISPARYTYVALVSNEFYGVDIPCATDNNDISSSYVLQQLCPFPGELVVEDVGISGIWVRIWPNVIVLIVMNIILRILSYLYLRVYFKMK